LQVRSSHVAFRKIEAPYLVGGAIRAAEEVYPSPTLVLTKSEVCHIMFVITESVSHTQAQPGEEQPVAV
jgi:hypothetical protein